MHQIKILNSVPNSVKFVDELKSLINSRMDRIEMLLQKALSSTTSNGTAPSSRDTDSIASLEHIASLSLCLVSH